MNYKKRDRLVFRKIVLISIFFQTLMIFYTLIPPFLVAIISFCGFLYYTWNLKKFFNIADSLLLTSILYIPTSTISVFGTSYSNLPLTWHNIIILLLMMYIAIEGTMNRSYLIILLTFLFFGLISSIKLPFIGDAFKQLLTISLFICSFLIGKRFKVYGDKLSDVGWKFYFIGVVSLALQVFIQRIYIVSTGDIIGNYAVMGINRIAYAGLMGDFSFAGLYLATGCLYAFIKYVHLKDWNLVYFITVEGFFISAMLFVSARTGLIALTITLVLYFLANIKNFSSAHILVLLFGVIAIPLTLSVLMRERGGQTLLDSSGRIDNYLLSLDAFSNKYFVGYGLGLNNLYNLVGLAVPHNFFIQYFLQIGIIGTVIILCSFFKFFTEEFRRSGYYKWFFVMITIGSMFIPDIVSSRFLFAIVVLCMMSATSANRQNYKMEVKNEKKSRKMGR
ncbi:O-antigen ligase family protein [Enterococcus mundtii]|uniref:O-antigen ligase-related domain-containing protein n=1 Tax=Enterococcus mundtii TaxID=53346 RepID=A0A2S7RP62_ENTMU|nr:O-antigen ligase family protein [Enterococcus mundtii]PQF21037.1 hypothetical protein CUS89_14195 [Enterococcus mundtii]